MSGRLKIFASQTHDDFVDNLLDAQVRRIDDFRVFRDDERRCDARRIGLVALRDLVAVALRRAALRPNFRRSVDIKLVGGIWKNDRTNVAPFHDQIVLGRAVAHAFKRNSANFRHGADA